MKWFDLLQEIIDDLLPRDDRVAWNVIDRLFGIKFAALAAGFGQDVHKMASDVQEPQFEHREKAGGSGADDNDVGLDQLRHTPLQIHPARALRVPGIISIVLETSA